MIALDTHVVVWLHAGELERIPEVVRDRLEADDLCVCPIVLLELEYLHEIGRIAVGADSVLGDLGSEIGLLVARDGFEQVVREALLQSWTRDPFDRVIAAHAVCSGLPLATADGALLKNCPNAFWNSRRARSRRR